MADTASKVCQRKEPKAAPPGRLMSYAVAPLCAPTRHRYPGRRLGFVAMTPFSVRRGLIGLIRARLGLLLPSMVT